MIRSNSSPATGSKRLPSRVSTFSIRFSAALMSVKASARGFTSVAITLSAWAAARRACTPLPVPMSSARSTRRRGVSRREPVRRRREARDPAGRIVHPVRERVEREVDALGGNDARARDQEPVVLGREAERNQLRRGSEIGARHRPVQEQEADRVAELVVRQAPREDDRVAELGRDAVVAEQPLDRLAAVADVTQRVADGERRVVVELWVPDRADAASCTRQAGCRAPLRCPTPRAVDQW